MLILFFEVIMELLSGIVERITYVNEENGYSVIKIKSKGFQDLVTVVGTLAGINVGSVIKAKGIWKVDHKYGKQFQAMDFNEEIPSTIMGIQKYLGSGLIKGIGPVNARRIVNHFKEETLRIIEDEPHRLNEVSGIGLKRVDVIKKAWFDQKEIKNIMLFLQSNGIATSHAIKIYKTYGDESINVVQRNPYRLSEDIWGIGFKTADKIAQQMGFEQNSVERCSAGIQHVVNKFVEEGHCYAQREELEERTVQVLEVDAELVVTTLGSMIETKKLIHIEEAIYLPPLYYSEIGVSNRLKRILREKSQFASRHLESVVQQIQRENNIEYDRVQMEAIQVAIDSKVMVLTGGPGTGKTTTTLAIIEVFKKLNAKVLLAAPTGRAAKRLSESTKMEAKTIHRLLEFKPGDGFTRNTDNPLDCNVLVVDEVSMMDIILMNHLLKALPLSCVLILVGDVDQLPSVGAGNVLLDVIHSKRAHVVKLTRIFRQAQGSEIVKNAHRINQGDFPSLRNKKNSDFFFIESDHPQDMVAKIIELCRDRLPKYYKINPLEDIQILTPMQRGEVGANNLNAELQKALNPSIPSIQYAGTTFKLNDKVMQVKNNYDKEVFNGDIGRILNIHQEDKTVMIDFEERLVQYDISEMDEVVLAYAITIHKSQGSEYGIVVAPITTSHYMLLQRNLLYTCMTRAKKIFILIGSKRAIGMAVSNNNIAKRNTLLCQFLQEDEERSGTNA
jgi:exodeoxyribonuclease V alpha subunit